MNTRCTILTANVSGSEEYLIISPTIYFLIPKHIISSERQGNNVSIILCVHEIQSTLKLKSKSHVC